MTKKSDDQVVVYVDDDPGFIDWCAKHPRGYVWNCKRDRTGEQVFPYMMHRASVKGSLCPHFKDTNQVGGNVGNLTSSTYCKACSTSREALETWATSKTPRSKLSYCSDCAIPPAKSEGVPTRTQEELSTALARGRKTFLLTWKTWPWDDFEAAVELTKSGSSYVLPWSVIAFKQVQPGDRVFLLRQGKKTPGLIASGVVASMPWFGKSDWGGRDTAEGYHVVVNFDTILSPDQGEVLPRTMLYVGALKDVNWNAQGSGIEIKPPAAAELELLWRDWLLQCGRNGGRSSLIYPGELPDSGEGIQEGEERLVQHKIKERSSALVEQKKQEARRQRQCLACEVCDFDFEVVFGSHGENFIECHHIEPLAGRRQSQITKLSDLALVCSNCHRMLHRNGTMTPQELKRLRGGIRQTP
jgi:5-methylcytosine-specific restriction protein A